MNISTVTALNNCLTQPPVAPVVPTVPPPPTSTLAPTVVPANPASPATVQDRPSATVLGIILGALAFVGIIWYLVRRRLDDEEEEEKKKKKQQQQQQQQPEFDSAETAVELQGSAALASHLPPAIHVAPVEVSPAH